MKSVFLRGLLPPIGGLCLHPAAASQQVFFEMIPLLPGERHSLTEIFCSLVYCMQFYRQTDESVLVSCFLESLLFGVFCPVVCVCEEDVCKCCESATAYQPYVLGYFIVFAFFSRMIKLLSIYHVSNLDA